MLDQILFQIKETLAAIQEIGQAYQRGPSKQTLL